MNDCDCFGGPAWDYDGGASSVMPVSLVLESVEDGSTVLSPPGGLSGAVVSCVQGTASSLTFIAQAQ